MPRPHPWFATSIATLLLASACSAQSGSPVNSTNSASSTTLGPSTTPTTASTTASSGAEAITLPTAPENARVDLAEPVFSNPTSITNPLFPISELASVVMLGAADGEPFRTEVTLLPGTLTIEWNGQQIEVLESQYVAFLNGRIHEVALDWYAQADDGSVWYLGEDVFNYEDGVVADTEGTWMAGKEGPGAMIMPSNPGEGDVYRPENAFPIVFEEVTVKSAGLTVQGPHGPVEGAIVVEELHMDGTFEDKTFAPGYGEFSTGFGPNLEAVALAVPADALTGDVPAELATLTAGAFETLGANESPNESIDWNDLSSNVDAMTTAWESYRSNGLPPMLETQMGEALDMLTDAVADESISGADATETIQAAINVARASLDFELRYRPVTEVDHDRFGLWVHQLRLDAAADDAGSVKGDVTAMEWVWNRFAHSMADADGATIESLLGDLRNAADAEDLSSVANSVTQLLQLPVLELPRPG